MEKLPEYFQNYGLRLSPQFPHINAEELEKVFKEVEKSINEGKFDDIENIGEDIKTDMDNYGYADSKEFLDGQQVVEQNVADPNMLIENGCEDIKQDLIGNYIQPTALERYPVPVPHSLAGMIIANDNFPGDYNFELIMNAAKYNNWVYSSSLNKVFINMGLPLPVQFRWTPSVGDLFIRATPLFANSTLAQEIVLRCLNHSSSTDISNKDVPDYVHRHVIRCLHPQTQYVSTGGRLSVLTPLGEPQLGTDTVRLMYKFMCKNSCSSGMNRRPLEVVFTLETLSGNILGRRRLEVRICSCPKRDKDKEEEIKGCGGGAGRKRKIHAYNPRTPRPTKLNKLGLEDELTTEDDDVTIHSLNLEVLGRNAAIKVLINAYDAMAGDAARRDSRELYQPYLDEIEKKINAIQKSSD